MNHPTVYRPQSGAPDIFVSMGRATDAVVLLTGAAHPGSFVAPMYLGDRVTRTELRQFNAQEIN